MRDNGSEGIVKGRTTFLPKVQKTTGEIRHRRTLAFGRAFCLDAAAFPESGSHDPFRGSSTAVGCLCEQFTTDRSRRIRGLYHELSNRKSGGFPALLSSGRLLTLILCDHAFESRPGDSEFLCTGCLCDTAFPVPLIVRGEVRDLFPLASRVLSVALGDGDSLPLKFQKVSPLTFVDGSDHGEHELSGRGGRVDVLFIGNERHTLPVQEFHDVKMILRAPGKAGEVVNVYNDNEYFFLKAIDQSRRIYGRNPKSHKIFQ